MAEDDWYDDFVDGQEKGPLKEKERQEVRARLVLAHVTRLRKRRFIYWLKTLSLMLGLAALASSPFGSAISWLIRLLNTKIGGGQ